MMIKNNPDNHNIIVKPSFHPYPNVLSYNHKTVLPAIKYDLTRTSFIFMI
jgi:hypothetical protein